MNKRYAVLRRLSKQNKKLFNDRVFSSRSKPIELSDIEQYQVSGVLTLAAFKANGSKLVPLVLKLLSEGHSLASIERSMGFRQFVLTSFVNNNKRLKEAVNRARKIHLDRVGLADILS